MKPIKVLELRLYAQQIGIQLEAGEIYTLMCNGFEGRLKRNKYVCICIKSLTSFAKIEDLDSNTKEIATRWAKVANMYQNDKERLKKEAQNKAELEKMKTFFKKERIPNENYQHN